MRKLYIITLFILLLAATNTSAQKERKINTDPAMSIDTLLHLISVAKEDTNKVRLLFILSLKYVGVDANKGVKYGEQSAELGLKLNWDKGVEYAYQMIGNNYASSLSFKKALSYFKKSLSIAEKAHDMDVVTPMTMNIGSAYLRMGDNVKAEEYLLKTIKLSKEYCIKLNLASTFFNLGVIQTSKLDYSRALDLYIYATRIIEETGNMVIVENDTFHFIQLDPRIAQYYASQEKSILSSINTNIGTSYLQQGNYPRAIEYSFKALKASESLGDKERTLQIIVNIANLYSKNSELEKAFDYMQKSLKLAQELQDRKTEATAWLNIGYFYAQQGNQQSALENYQKCLKIAEDISNTIQIGHACTNIGGAYTDMKNYPKAFEYNFKALKTGEDINDNLGIAEAAINIAVIYLRLSEDTTIVLSKEDEALSEKYLSGGQKILPNEKKARLQLAIDYFQKGLQLTTKLQLRDRVSECYKYLSKAYQLNGDSYRALEYYQNYTTIKDSLFSNENNKKIMQQQFKYDYGKREDSIKLENEKKKLAMQREMEVAAVRYEFEKKQAKAKSEKERQQLKYEQQLKEQQIEYEYNQKIARAEAEQKQKETERKQREAIAKVEQEKKDALTKEQLLRERNIRYASITGILALAVFSFFIFKERKKSDALLLNILPSSVAKELKAKGSADAKLFDDVTVLFTDFVSFTKVSEKLTPQELVNELHNCFREFDNITHKYGIEKIKTVGDAYLAVCGLPKANPQHAQNVVKAAIEIRDFMAKRKEQLGDRTFGIRLGVHSGNVVAGIVGIKKFAYDIWGDTVNTAARMEQNSIGGRINISGSTYELVKNDFECEYRGEIEAKNKGALKMYFVNPQPLKGSS